MSVQQHGPAWIPLWDAAYCHISGRLAEDPVRVQSRTQADLDLAAFTIVQRRWDSATEKGGYWQSVRILAFDQVAEFALRRLTKGSVVMIHGELRTRRIRRLREDGTPGRGTDCWIRARSISPILVHRATADQDGPAAPTTGAQRAALAQAREGTAELPPQSDPVW